MMHTAQPISTLVMVALALAAGCDTPAAPAPATQSSPAISPAAATQPTTKGVRVPGFPADGLYVGRGYTVSVATGERGKIETLIDKCLPELSRGYRVAGLREELLKFYDAAKPAYNGAAVLIEETPGAATRPAKRSTTQSLISPPATTGGQGGKPVARIYFLGTRSFVEISKTFKESAATGFGMPVEFDPPTYVNFFIHPVREYDDESDTPKYYLSDTMSSGQFGLAIRVGDRFSGPKVPGMILEDIDVTLYADKLTLAALPTSRPATRPRP